MIRMAIIVAVGMVAHIPAQEEPKVPIEVFSRALKADAKTLQETLDFVSTNPNRKGARQTSKIMAMMLVRYADRTQDVAAKTQAIKVVQFIENNEWDQATKALEQLGKAKADKDALKARLPVLTSSEVGAAFRSSKSHGLNIDRDLREQLKKLDNLDLVGLVAARTLVLSDFLSVLPPRVFEHNFKKTEWDRWCRDMETISKEILRETAKPKEADKDKVSQLLGKLDATCTKCHPTTGRDGP